MKSQVVVAVAGARVVSQDGLASVLAQFARTMITDFPIQQILDGLVQSIVQALPISGAGVTLISPGMAPQYVAASNHNALRFERLQTELGQGPCLSAYESTEPVLIADLAGDSRFALFGPAAVGLGMAAVFAFPLRHGAGCLGALDLYRDHTGGMRSEEVAAAQTLADVTAAYLLNAQARERALAISNRFQHSSMHDSLTGLPNRELLAERLEHAARRASRSHTSAAVLFADLDRFKAVNDTYGHTVGDAVLVAVGERLRSTIRPGDTLARVSGDEFVILCEDVAHPDDVHALAARIGRAFTAPFHAAEVEVMITASVGIAYAGPGEQITSQLIIDADIAMYQAKRRGGNDYQVLDVQAAHERHERNHLSRDLPHAMTAGQLDLLYQPILDAGDTSTVGVEALLRWTHPDRGPIPAATTIDLAERNGLIVELGTWILDRACRDRTRWLTEVPDHPLDLSVNVSPLQLMHPDFPDTVADILQRTGMDPSALVLEITEGVFVADLDRARDVLSQLRSLGLRLALDDFGTGYSSLSYLRHLPFDIVKIDRHFVESLTNDPRGQAIVAAVTQLAHALDMTTTAEGVETREQYRALAHAHCDLVQGFLFSPPQSSTAITNDLLAAHPLRM